MATAKLGGCLLLALTCFSTGCAATGSRYPFREKPLQAQRAPSGPDADLANLQRELAMYSD